MSCSISRFSPAGAVFAVALLMSAAIVGLPNSAAAQTVAPQTDNSVVEPIDPADLRAADEAEETFDSEQRALQADEEDNDPANAQRLMILDSRGRPYMYDGVRDGIVCRARRVLVRRDAFGGGIYRRSVRCNSRTGR